MLSRLSDKEIEKIFALSELKRYTAYSTEKTVYKKQVPEVPKQRIIYDGEECVERMIGFAVPIANCRDVEARILSVVLKHQMPDSSISELTTLLKGISEEISRRLESMMQRKGEHAWWKIIAARKHGGEK